MIRRPSLEFHEKARLSFLRSSLAIFPKRNPAHSKLRASCKTQRTNSAKQHQTQLSSQSFDAAQNPCSWLCRCSKPLPGTMRKPPTSCPLGPQAGALRRTLGLRAFSSELLDRLYTYAGRTGATYCEHLDRSGGVVWKAANPLVQDILTQNFVCNRAAVLMQRLAPEVGLSPCWYGSLNFVPTLYMTPPQVLWPNNSEMAFSESERQRESNQAPVNRGARRLYHS